MVAKKKETEKAGAPTATPKRKRVKVKTGQIVAVPLSDGTFALAHVALATGGAITAHFAHRKSSPEELLVGLDEAMQHHQIAMLAVTSDEIYDGHWPVIGHREPTYPAGMLDMKGRSSTASISRALFDAYYGVAPWDGMHDPRYFEKKLLPGVPVPPTVRYKRDFERDAAAQAVAVANTAATQPGAEQAITQGPGAIHIEIKYPGDDLPTIPLLKRRQAIENALEAAGVGEVTDAGGGGGVMDIYLETNDVARAMPFVHAAIKEAGFENDARIDVAPVSEDDEHEPGDDDDT